MMNKYAVQMIALSISIVLVGCAKRTGHTEDNARTDAKMTNKRPLAVFLPKWGLATTERENWKVEVWRAGGVQLATDRLSVLVLVASKSGETPSSIEISIDNRSLGGLQQTYHHQTTVHDTEIESPANTWTFNVVAAQSDHTTGKILTVGEHIVKVTVAINGLKLPSVDIPVVVKMPSTGFTR